MSKKIDHSLGITPIVIRRAAFYLQLGEGVYRPEHPHYDEVRVTTSYDIRTSELFPEEWSQGRLVTFYQDGRKVRWVEFGCKVVGAGGDPLLRQVADLTDDEVLNG